MNLEAKNITVSYGKDTVLCDVSHTFKEGKITVILGANGCGKTTFIKSVVKLYAKSGNIAYIPQELYGEVGLTVRDTVALGRYDRHKFLSGETSEDKKYIDDALSVMNLNDKKDRIYDTLSGGEKQRCMAARAICQNAEWFIMDEPASNLDVIHTKHILETARKLVDEEGKSFIIVLHDINAAASYGDEFILMKDGKITEVTSDLTAEGLSKVYGASFDSVKTSSGKTVFYAD